jgi:hypothetical protein
MITYYNSRKIMMILKQLGDVVVNTTNKVVHNIKCDDKLGDLVSIPDYEELHPKELLKYDGRTTIALEIC